jgi:hypothetical protein
MALGVETRTPDLIPDLWAVVVQRLVDPDKERMHEVEMLTSLLLVGAYEAESSRPVAARMREELTLALERTTAIGDDFHRRRRARAWIGAGRVALGSGDDALAETIAIAIAPDLRDMRSAIEGHPWRDPDRFFNEVFTAGQTMRIRNCQTRTIAPRSSRHSRPFSTSTSADQGDAARRPCVRCRRRNRAASPPSGLVWHAGDCASGRGARPGIRSADLALFLRTPTRRRLALARPL